MTISRVKFPWPPFFRIFIFFDEIFISVCGTTYLMRDDGATVVNVRSSRVIWSPRNPTDVLAQPRRGLRSKNKQNSQHQILGHSSKSNEPGPARRSSHQRSREL